MKNQLAYFLDKDTFEIKECILVDINEINLDLETNGNSSFRVAKKLNIEQNDFMYIKNDGIEKFFGIVQSQENENNSNIYVITCKDILAMLDFESFVANENTISNVGIEDFLANRISEEFVTNTDSFLNKAFFEVEALTHTPKIISLSSLVNIQDNIYNFLTLVGNTIENYDLKFDFIISRNHLKLEISTKTDEKVLVDTTISDVINYSETFSISYIAKVECLDLSTNTKYYKYLLNDRTTTSNQNDPNRVKGTTKRITAQRTEDVEQAIADAFKSNSYQHNITFEIKQNSALIDVPSLKQGTPIQIKTKNNVITDTYISKITEKNDIFKQFTCGNLRVNFIDKILKERNENL